MNKKISVVLADDHAMVLEGLRAVLSIDPNLEVVGEASNGLMVLEILSMTEVDVVVLDINMPEMDGLTCAKSIKMRFPSVKVIILTSYPQESFVEHVLKLGLEGCLLKTSTGNELVAAINRVMEGRSYFDLIKDFNSNRTEIAQFKLGTRELEIIKLLAKGYSNVQIADALTISENTVKTHRKNIMRKTGLHSATQLVQFAISNKLIAPPGN